MVLPTVSSLSTTSSSRSMIKPVVYGLGLIALLAMTAFSRLSLETLGCKVSSGTESVVAKDTKDMCDCDCQAPVPASVPVTSNELSVQEQVLMCNALTEEEKKGLAKEIAHYEKSGRFRDKIKEVKGESRVALHHQGISKYPKTNVLTSHYKSFIELGCAAGMMLQVVRKHYEASQPDVARHYVGVELVTGWAKFGKEYFAGKMSIYEGDITEFSLPDDAAHPQTFDFVMLNDVMEHIQKTRYGCFFQQLQKITKVGSVVYMHTPTPAAQIVDADQFYENVLPHHYVIMVCRWQGLNSWRWTWTWKRNVEKAQYLQARQRMPPRRNAA